jgi:glutaminase
MMDLLFAKEVIFMTLQVHNALETIKNSDFALTEEFHLSQHVQDAFKMQAMSMTIKTVNAIEVTEALGLLVKQCLKNLLCVKLLRHLAMLVWILTMVVLDVY